MLIEVTYADFLPIPALINFPKCFRSVSWVLAAN